MVTAANNVRIELIRNWEEESITNLYRIGGWLKEDLIEINISKLIKGSFLFAVAVDISSGETIGMGRVISDGIADAYIQDVVVLHNWRGLGVGKMIVSVLLQNCFSKGISWIGLIAQPGTSGFYSILGFSTMENHIPMLICRR